MAMQNESVLIAGLLVAVFAMPIQVIAAHAPSYTQTLEQFQAEKAKQPSPFSDGDREVMKRAGESLAKRMPDPGINVGERASEFTLPNAYGKPISLSESLKEGPVVLVFYGAPGARLITVTPQTPDKSAEQIKNDGLPFEVLSDLDNNVMKVYHLYFELDDELVRVCRKHGLDIEAFNGAGRNILPVPGTFVIGADGMLVAMHADPGLHAAHGASGYN